MKPTPDEVRAELERLTQVAVLTPQERQFLSFVVRATLQGQTGGLYQRALIDELGVQTAKHIGVVASRTRKKLREHYERLPAPPPIRIEFSPRGYETTFVRSQSAAPLRDRVQTLVTNAKAAIDQRTLPGSAVALKLLEQALALQSNHPLLLSLKAYCLATRSLFGTFPRLDLEQAEQLVGQTNAAASRPWESWFAEGCVQMALHWNWKAAGAAFSMADELSGSEARYQPWYTTYLSAQGRADEAVSLRRTAMTRWHDSPIVRADLASALIFAGRLDEAAETLDDAIALFGPRAHYLLHVHRAILLEGRGDSAGALKAIEKAPLRWPRTAITLGFRALFGGLSGDRALARRHFVKLRAARLISGAHIPAGQLGLAALGTGDIPTAMRWLREGAVVERDPNFVLITAYPFFRHLYEEPAFNVLVEEMGIAAARTAPSPYPPVYSLAD